MEIIREQVDCIIEALEKPLPVIQVMVGSRQVGKTTAAKQIADRLGYPSVYATADSTLPPGSEWMETQWRLAEARAKETNQPVLLILDEIQKVRGWSETIKKLWDASDKGRTIKLLILGSSSLLLQSGLNESLAGRFFLHRFPHWKYEECREAFGWDLNHWLYFGGYPGAAAFQSDESHWKQYVSDSLIEAVLARDVLQMQKVAKPTLLRHLFGLAARFPAQIISYNKMLGQLQDAGNTTTLAHYIELLESAFLLSGLELFSRGQRRKRGSSPKLVFWNNALINAMSLKGYEESMRDSSWWGRVVENAVGAHLLNTVQGVNADITYWRKGNVEVDFVVNMAEQCVAIEVKSGRSDKMKGLHEFGKLYSDTKTLIVGGNGIPLEDFFKNRITAFL